jgi:hypothetical protein
MNGKGGLSEGMSGREKRKGKDTEERRGLKYATYIHMNTV